MKPFTGILLGTVMAIGMSSSSAVSQTAEPTYKADPSVYKLIFEDANFRVIEATHIKGIHDKAHSHGGQFIVYNLTDCTMKTYAPDGRQQKEMGRPARSLRCLRLHRTPQRTLVQQTASRFLSKRSRAAPKTATYRSRRS